MDSFEKYFNKTLRFLSFRSRSEKEIRDYLLRHSGKQSASRIDSGQARMTVIEEIIGKLKDLHFLDDTEFAKWLIESRQGAKPRGLRVIKMELKQKGITDDIIEAALADTPNKSELELAKKAAFKKVTYYRKLPVLEFKQKLSQFLMRRGFDWELVREVVDEIAKKEYNSL